MIRLLDGAFVEANRRRAKVRLGDCGARPLGLEWEGAQLQIPSTCKNEWIRRGFHSLYFRAGREVKAIKEYCLPNKEKRIMCCHLSRPISRGIIKNMGRVLEIRTRYVTRPRHIYYMEQGNARRRQGTLPSLSSAMAIHHYHSLFFFIFDVFFLQMQCFSFVKK